VAVVGWWGVDFGNDTAFFSNKIFINYQLLNWVNQSQTEIPYQLNQDGG
jgi:hypothetical protein